MRKSRAREPGINSAEREQSYASRQGFLEFRASAGSQQTYAIYGAFFFYGGY
jgi:hypothetical protein